MLFNVANLNSTSLGIKIIAGIFTSKAIAIFIGAEGLALIGNLSNFLKAVQSFSVLGFYKGIVKYIGCLLYTSPSPRDRQKSRMPSSA